MQASVSGRPATAERRPTTTLRHASRAGVAVGGSGTAAQQPANVAIRTIRRGGRTSPNRQSAWALGEEVRSVGAAAHVGRGMPRRDNSGVGRKPAPPCRGITSWRRFGLAPEPIGLAFRGEPKPRSARKKKSEISREIASNCRLALILRDRLSTEPGAAARDPRSHPIEPSGYWFCGPPAYCHNTLQ